jgi:hypothetical protein
MRNAILTLLGSVLLVASVAQAASATQRHHGRRVASNPAPLTQQFRDSSASVWTAAEPGWSGWSPSGYYSHGFSAPAGR